jgi:hypothetical protein
MGKAALPRNLPKEVQKKPSAFVFVIVVRSASKYLYPSRLPAGMHTSVTMDSMTYIVYPYNSLKVFTSGDTGVRIETCE